MTFGRRDEHESWMVRLTAVTQLVDVWDISHISSGEHTKQLQIAPNNSPTTRKGRLFPFIPRGTTFENEISCVSFIVLKCTHVSKKKKRYS